MDREFQRLYNAGSAARREARIQALIASQPPEVPNFAQRSREASNYDPHGYAMYGLQMEEEELRARWRHGLDETRRREIDSLPDPETAHAGMLGSLRAALFREVTRDDIPVALAAHDDIVRVIANGHGWLIPTFEMSLDQYVNAEYREYQLTCNMLGQPIVREVRRIMEHLFEQLLVQRILDVIRDGRIRTRDGRLAVRDLQYALTTPTMEGLIDFIVHREGGIRRGANGYGERNTTMETLANPANLERLGTAVATLYRGNIQRGRDYQQVIGRFDATARYFDGIIATAGVVELEGPGGVMPFDRYRQLQGVFEGLTDGDLFQRRARRIDHAAVAVEEARQAEAEARQAEERERYREFERRLDARPAERRRARPSRRPLDDIDRLFMDEVPAAVKEEFEQLPKSKFYSKLSEPTCRVCLDTLDEDGNEVNIACRHPQLEGGIDICGAGYHRGCITTLKQRLKNDFHCLRCFAGRNRVATRNAEGVVVGEHTPPFYLFYELRNPLTPEEARENEEYEAAMATGPPTRQQEAQNRGRERDEDEDEKAGKSQRRGGKKHKRTMKKYR